MGTSVNIKTNNNDHSIRNFVVGTAGLAAGWESETYLRKYLRLPIGMYFRKEFKGVQGGGYKPYFETAIRQNHLENELKVYNLNEQTKDTVLKELGIKLPNNNASKGAKSGKKAGRIITHILRIGGKSESSVNRTLKGENAFFLPRKNAVVCNFDKFGTPVFHELQHKLNSQSKNPLIKVLVKIRNPLAFYGTTAVSVISLFTDKKTPEQKQRFNDKVKNNCGLLATMCMLPFTIEEYIANIKGTKLAEQAGVKGEMLTKVKKAHKLSMIGYGAGAIVTGLACWGGNKIRDLICSNKVKEPQQFGGYYRK